MPFPYYARLKPRDKAIYRKSDAIGAVALPDSAGLGGEVAALETALLAADRLAVERATRALCAAMLARLEAPPVRVRVLSARPSASWGETHGEYEPAADSRRARITLWMRTAKHKRVVAFRAYLRTLLHELCHHIDYELLGLEDSFHTEGFFKREASLFRQLVPVSPQRARRPRPAADSSPR